ncbi:MAG: ATP-binding protein [Thalassolituus sp.]
MTGNQRLIYGTGPRLLRLYSYYSLFLALSLIVIDGLDKADALLGGAEPQLFLMLSSVYVFAAATFAALVNRRTDSQVATSYVFLETALLTGMMYASGGLEAGFSSLLLIPVVIANLLAPGILGYAVAAWMTLAIIYSEHIVTNDFGLTNTANTGVFGGISFLLAWVTQVLSHRIKDALSLASNNARDVRRLQRLNQQAMMNLPDGIIACAPDRTILFINDAASGWFNLKPGMFLPADIAAVQDRKTLKRERQHLAISRIQTIEAEGDFLLLIEDEARISAEAQQIKLASLGRLTASIAHEIRNPLSALNQAAQLLAETEYLRDGERRLTTMIEDNSQRINRIISDILQLSRGKAANAGTLQLSPFLQEFRSIFRQQDTAEDYQIELRPAGDFDIYFDRDHLLQVLTNLTQNGLRYARRARNQTPSVTIEVSQEGPQRITIEVRDNGLGVAENQLDRLFEPFSTTEHEGTGLGLYLCRELCHANEAHIEYSGEYRLGACFRITAQRR